MKRYVRYLPFLLIILVGIAAYVFDLKSYVTLDALRAHQHDLELIIQKHYIVSIISFVLFYIIVVWLSMPIASFMTLSGGFLLGQTVGTVASVIGATIGSCLFFVSVKMASQSMTQKVGPWVQKMQQGFQEDALRYLVTLRLIPLFPFVAVNLVAAFLQIPLRTFLIGTFLGIIPGTFVYVSLGVALHDAAKQETLLNTSVLWALSGLSLLSLMPVLYKKFKDKKANL